jgi:AraC family transcriptional regulator
MQPQPGGKSSWEPGSRFSYAETIRSETKTVAGLCLVRKEYGAGFVMPPHSHERWKICLTLSGLHSDLERGVQRHKGPSFLSVLPPDERHSSVFSEDTKCFHIEFDEDFISPPLGLIYIADGRIPILAHRINAEFGSSDASSALLIHGLSLELLAFLSRAKNDGAARPRWLDRAADLLQERSTEAVTAEEIAAEIGVHPVYLSRQFKRHFGVNMGEYLREAKVRLACDELRTGKSLAEIAAAAGFADQSHFTRVFKKILGETPGEFRQRIPH